VVIDFLNLSTRRRRFRLKAESGLTLPRRVIAKAGKNRDGGQPDGFSSAGFTPIAFRMQEK